MKYEEYLACASDMKRMDADAVARMGITYERLTAYAAGAVYEFISEKLPPPARAVILSGTGNNGADGRILAGFLTDNGYTVEKIDIGQSVSDRKRGDPFAGCDIIVDAVFGTGFRPPLPNNLRLLFKRANASPAKKVSIDIPSGVSGDNGEADIDAFRADYTVTFEFLKRGMAVYPGIDYCGEIAVVPIGFPDETREMILSGEKKSRLITREAVSAVMSKYANKTLNTHKGDFGNLFAYVGSENMPGAAYLSVMGAMRSGAGLVTLASDKRVMAALMARLAEPVFLPVDCDNFAGIEKKNYSAYLLGCGISTRHPDVYKRILMENVMHSGKVAVIDADGLNILAEHINMLKQFRRGNAVITPHPGEMAALCKSAGYIEYTTAQDVQRSRINAATRFADQYGCVVVLKGARTVAAVPGGGIYVNTTGNPGMSTAGSGDVLAGIIAGLAARGFSPEEAATTGVYLHGAAGDGAAAKFGEVSMIASDILAQLTVNK
ncbi:bifunctional NAD(P)H-hydrate repair enzyme Nnr [Clostridia bacterium]|nr:bifunctional NAD(P)H-hydrate repair enzyme Nnr [Clostridia bacterium]